MAYEQAKNAEFMVNPSMRGHHIAKDTFEKAMEIYNKYATDDVHKLFFETVVRDSDNWNYWAMHVTGKYLANVRYVIRRLGTVSFNYLRYYVNQNSSMLKDELWWALEVLAYFYEKEAYQESYVSTYGFYGMKRDEAIERLDSYIDRLISPGGKMEKFVEELGKLADKEGENDGNA